MLNYLISDKFLIDFKEGVRKSKVIAHPRTCHESTEG